MPDQVPLCEPCAMGYSCPDHDPRPETIGRLGDGITGQPLPPLDQSCYPDNATPLPMAYDEERPAPRG